MNTKENNDSDFYYFFYPEIKKFLNEEKIKEIETSLLSKDEDIFKFFNENRHKGENDSYICTLIRQDSVEEFISYVNKTNFPLKSKITHSLFESNSFLNDQNATTLIEYACFFGSIQIFQYLKMNNVELTPSLWLYSIHSQNAEIIHLLEYNEVQPPNNSYFDCFNESIKCHHNDIAEYIKNNFLENMKYEKTVYYILRYHNYANFPADFDTDDEFFYLCKFNYNKLVDLFVKKKEKYLLELIKKNDNVLTIRSDTEYKTLIFYNLLVNQKKFDVKSFQSNRVMEKIAIPASLSCFYDELFLEFKELTDISIPPSVTSIGKHSFDGCLSLA
ncbi:hypothetical protein M9Y10_033900 [Tritrichomonas musculus]|uniref:DUF3447 domain-containing protein n=1 Tax=Tritrichomonas musculus TaxID=1915356 RepID=A0ABR2KDE3_9EUKA